MVVIPAKCVLCSEEFNIIIDYLKTGLVTKTYECKYCWKSNVFEYKLRSDEVIKNYPKSEATKKAKQIVNQIHNLKVGAIAPSFEGKDVDGNPVALEDFRGKLTFLVFWGFW